MVEDLYKYKMIEIRLKTTWNIDRDFIEDFYDCEDVDFIDIEDGVSEFIITFKDMSYYELGQLEELGTVERVDGKHLEA